MSVKKPITCHLHEDKYNKWSYLVWSIHTTQDHVQLSATAVDIRQALTQPLSVQWEGAIWEQI